MLLLSGTLQLDRLVEIAYKEASAICQDLLGISAPTVAIDKPLKLAVMAPLSQGHKEPGTTTNNVPPNDDNPDRAGQEILQHDHLSNDNTNQPPNNSTRTQ